MTHLYLIALLLLAAGSCASTANVWLPCPRLVYVDGLEQALNALLSSLHKNLTPTSLSLKVKLALVWFVALFGIELITGDGGGVMSIVHEKLAAPLGLPAASCALTENVWLP